LVLIQWGRKVRVKKVVGWVRIHAKGDDAPTTANVETMYLLYKVKGFGYRENSALV
jgi:hypothetical protein